MDTSKFEIGQSVSKKIEITQEMSTNRTGSPGDDVLSTPAMLGLMEGVCISHSDPKLEDGSATVGYAVDGLRHIARSDVGETVDVTATLIEFESVRLSTKEQSLLLVSIRQAINKVFPWIYGWKA